MARSYRQLLVWQKAKALTLHVYRTSEHFPESEIFGLVSQARRAAVSVVSNIAEGQGRLTPGELVHFLGLARGSLLELETQLDLSCDLGYFGKDTEQFEKEIYEVLGLLNRLIDSVRAKRRIPL